MRYLTPLMYDEKRLNPYKEGSLFKNLTFYDQNIHNMSDFPLAIVALDKQLMNAFRNYFYQLGDHFSFPLLDLGLMDNNDKTLGYLNEISKHTTILVIGGTKFQPESNTALVKNHFVETEQGNAYKYIGYQRHRVPLQAFNAADQFQNISLGELRKNITSIEPLLRTCKGLVFELDAIRQSDLGISVNNMCGLTMEESAQICRYAGLSPDLKFIHFPSLQPQFAYGNMEQEYAQSVSTLSWYFLEGILHKTYETPDQNEHISYVINSDILEDDVTFIKTERTGRWWMKYGEKQDYIPCMYEDFVQSREGKIPDRLIQYCLD